MDYFAYVEGLRPKGSMNSWDSDYERKQKPRVMFQDNGALYTILNELSSEFSASKDSPIAYVSNRNAMKQTESGIDLTLKVIEASTGTSDTLDARAQLSAGRKVFIKAIAEGKRVEIIRVK